MVIVTQKVVDITILYGIGTLSWVINISQQRGLVLERHSIPIDQTSQLFHGGKSGRLMVLVCHVNNIFRIKILQELNIIDVYYGIGSVQSDQWFTY